MELPFRYKGFLTNQISVLLKTFNFSEEVHQWLYISVV